MAQVPSTFSLLAHFSIMSLNNSCVHNCSGHGECHNGTCVCEIQYEGDECRTMNASYFVGFASVYFTLALVCSIQLVMCIVAEYQRMKGGSLRNACRVTTQKLLYFVVFLACVLRGTYFTSPTAYNNGWSNSLMNAYYPLLLSGSSLIACFWAEVFHLRDVRWEKPQFLSKSFLAFATFNFIAYSLLLAELIAVRFSSPSPELKIFYKHFFNGCYAVLLFIVVIFFLIYGFQVFFKIQGGFLNDSGNAAEVQNLVGRIKKVPHYKHIDTSQLQQSRLGLLSQALMLSIIVVFLCSETLSEFWKKKVPQHSRNWHDLLFRVVEIGVALWFPCVLWNCMSPEQLWILNPKRIIKKLDMEVISHVENTEENNKLVSPAGDDDSNTCYMCWFEEIAEKGPLINPCKCRGDTRYVHPECLRRWLMEKAENKLERAENKLELSCGVCGSVYRIDKISETINWRSVITKKHWFQIGSIVTTMCVFGAGCLIIFRLFLDPVIQLSAVLTTLLIEYACINCLSQNWSILYERAKISATKVVGVNLSTISDNIAIDIPQPSCAN